MTEVDRYLAELRSAGVLADPALARAFRAVPRELFVAAGFRDPNGGWTALGDPGLRDAVCRDTALVTKLARRRADQLVQPAVDDGPDADRA